METLWRYLGLAYLIRLNERIHALWCFYPFTGMERIRIETMDIFDIKTFSKDYSSNNRKVESVSLKDETIYCCCCSNSKRIISKFRQLKMFAVNKSLGSKIKVIKIRKKKRNANKVIHDDIECHDQIFNVVPIWWLR